MTHLLNRLLFYVPVIKHAQYLHPCKKNDSVAANAISNLFLSMMCVLTNKLSEVFHIQSPITSEEICDKIRTQCMRFQMEPFQDEWFKNPLEQVDSGTSDCSTTWQSYWPQVLNDCGLQPACKHSTLCKRVDNFWSKLGSLTDEHGNLKYPKLYAVVQVILSISDGNAYPERGFSINKQLLQSHGYVMKEKSIVSLRLLKDELIKAGGVLKFPYTIELINSIKNARVKYFADGAAEVDCRERETTKNASSWVTTSQLNQ